MGAYLRTAAMKLTDLIESLWDDEPMQLRVARKHLAKGGRLSLMADWDGKTYPASTSTVISIDSQVRDIPDGYGGFEPGVFFKLWDGNRRPGFDYPVKFDQLENMEVHFMPGDEERMILVSRSGTL